MIVITKSGMPCDGRCFNQLLLPFFYQRIGTIAVPLSSSCNPVPLVFALLQMFYLSFILLPLTLPYPYTKILWIVELRKFDPSYDMCLMATLDYDTIRGQPSR